MTQFRLTQISSALAAAGLLSATGVFAANIAGTNNAANNYIAPATFAATSKAAGTAVVPTAGYGAKFRIQAAAGQPLASNGDNINFTPFYFAADGSFLFIGPAVADATLGASAVILTLTGNTLAKSVAIVATTKIAVDDVGGKQVGVIKNIKTATGAQTPTQISFDVATVSIANLGDATGAVITAGEQAAIAALIAAGDKIPMSAYSGPSIARAGKPTDGAGTISVTIFGDYPFNAGLTQPGDDVFDGIKVMKSDGTASASVSYKVTVTDADGQWFTFNNAGGAFAEIITQAVPKFGSTKVQDLATNPITFTTTATPVITFAKPAYAASTAKAVAATLGTDSTANRALLYTPAGLGSDVSASANVAVRFAENLDCATAQAADFAVVPAGLTVTGIAACAGSTVTVTLTAVAPGPTLAWAVDPANGKLSFNATPVTVQAIFEAGTPLKTAAPGSQALAAAADNLAATTTFSGMAEAPTLATRDDDTNGLLDGATIGFKQDVGTVAGADFTLKTAFGGTARDIGFNATKVGTSSVKLVMTAPTTADWTENGTGAEAGDTALYIATNFNTGLSGAGVKYTAALAAAPAMTYSAVYGPTTGELAKIGSGVAFAGLPAITDGASPLVTKATFNTLQGSTPAKGNLVLVASETLAVFGAGPNGSQYSLSGSPITLTNLNDGLGNVTFALSTTSVANDTITINDVSATAVAKVLTIGGLPGYRDAALNVVTTAPAGVTIGTGNTVFNAPKFIQAIAARAGGGVGANINQIVLRVNKPVALAPVGKLFDANGVLVATIATAAPLEDDQFKVRANVPINGVNTNVDISLRASDVDLTQAGTGYITLNLPAPGIIGTANTITVDYQNGTAPGARLVSTDVGATGPVVFSVIGGAFVGPDDNTIDVALPVNSRNLLIQEMTGKLTLDGTAAIENGSIVRADLVKFDPVTVVQRGTVRVPCDCTSGTQTVTLQSIDAGLAGAIDDARRLNQNSIRVYVTTSKQINTPSVVSAAIQAAGGPAGTTAPAPVATNGGLTTQYEADLNINSGNITSPGSGNQVNGSLVIGVTPTLTSFNTTYQVMTPTSAGVFRLSAGVNGQNAAEGLWWVVSVKRPTDTRFRMITSAVPSFANFVPFRQELAATGNIITANLGTVNLGNLIDIPVAATATWQLLPVKGVVSITTDAVRKNIQVPMQRLFMNVQAADGAPNTAWSGDGDVDEAFTLSGNTLQGAVQIGSQTANIDNIRSVTGGFGIAWQNAGSNYRTPGSGNIAIANATPLFVTIPVTSTTSASATIPAGWSLITMNADRDLTVAANQSNITAAILVGAGQQSKTWFKGETSGNSLTTLSAGKAYFVYFSAATSAFGF